MTASLPFNGCLLLPGASSFPWGGSTGRTKTRSGRRAEARGRGRPARVSLLLRGGRAGPRYVARLLALPGSEVMQEEEARGGVRAQGREGGRGG
eukprot:220464-Hanusia_phi.AAC.1